jgi:rubrerythrin
MSLTGKKPKLVSIAINKNQNKQYLNQRCFLLRNFKFINNYYFSTIFNGVLLNYINKTIGNGTNQENVSHYDILSLKIPIPKTPEKLQYWVDRISTPYDEKNNKLKEIKELEKKVQYRIKEIIETEDCEEKEFNNILKFITKKNKYKASDGNLSGKFRFYSSSQDKLLFRDDYEFENKHILIGRGGVSSIHLTSKFSVTHDDVYVLNSHNINIAYIYYYLKSNIKLISDGFKGSTIKHSSKTALSEITIPIPTNPELIQEMEPDFQRIEQLQGEVKEAEELYKQYIKELAEEAIPPELNIKQEVKVNSDVETISDTSSITSMIEEKEEIEEIEINSSSLRITKVKIPNKKQCKGCDKVVTIKTLKLYDGNNCKKCFDKL